MYGRDVVSVSACEQNKVRGKALMLNGVRCQFVLFVYFLFISFYSSYSVRRKALK